MHVGMGDLTPPLSAVERWDPRLQSHTVNLRWLAATSLIALAAATMLASVLHATLRGTAKPVPAPLTARETRVGTTEADGRSDKLPPPAPLPDHRNVQVRAEQVTAGSGVTPFTYLVAHLGRDAPETVAKAAVPARLAARTPAVSPDHDRQATALPPEIVSGASRATAASLGGLAYAAKAPFDFEPGPRGTPLNVTVVAGSRSPPADMTRVIVAQRGDGLGHMLGLLGLAQGDVGEIAAALGSTAGRSSFLGGEKLVLREGAASQGAPPRPITLRLQRPDGSAAAAALSDAGHYVSAVVSSGLFHPGLSEDAASEGSDLDPAMPDHGSVKDSLVALAGHAVEEPVIDELLRLSGSDLDLGAPVSPNDTAELLYSAETDAADADPILDYAALTLEGNTHRFYRFESADDDSVDYYDQDGHSLTKFLLRKPVANGRLGDGFGWRVHPVLRDRRFHEGVDYAAPYGSPVVAAGAGVVEKIDFESGYGKYIRVRHDLGYETTYAHVSGYPRGTRVGQRVRQGETIAFIGSTGLSTGPHLYYEVKINDHNVDPLRIKLSGGRILQNAALAAFQQQRDRIDTLIRASAGTGTQPGRS